MKVGQTRLQSLIEVFINVGVGFLIGLLSNLIVLPMFGYDVSVLDGIGISVVFTLISVVRSYIVRRFFNFWHLK